MRTHRSPGSSFFCLPWLERGRSQDTRPRVSLDPGAVFLQVWNPLGVGLQPRVERRAELGSSLAACGAGRGHLRRPGAEETNSTAESSPLLGPARSP